MMLWADIHARLVLLVPTLACPCRKRSRRIIRGSRGARRLCRSRGRRRGRNSSTATLGERNASVNMHVLLNVDLQTRQTHLEERLITLRAVAP